MSATHMALDRQRISRLKLAELTSSIGAGVIGVGIGTLFATWFSDLGLPILALGVLLHSWGMRDKHEVEAGSERPLWTIVLYWACWMILAALVFYVLARVGLGIR